MIALPPSFLRVPLAHRGLHDRHVGRIENTSSALRAAVGAGYGIELDLQMSSDGHAMVFHDYHLDRLTRQSGLVREHSRAELCAIPHAEGTRDRIVALDEALAIVDGAVPLLIELKDPDLFQPSPDDRFERAVAAALAGYRGDVAVMSFSPHVVQRLAVLLPHVARGMITSEFAPEAWPGIPLDTLAWLRTIPDFETCGASFISHHRKDLDSLRVAELKARGVPVLCWTVRSAKQERDARRVADNITFEGYAPPIPG